ncbi:TonB-dependent receptor [Gillisia limnaea]|uniref:TonB-dependent receptor plug n=1 Tax=Gillisia limnaea (strain DSM 15749 / LMG 21470 / R-8282) TaxID=865937 RepID=H2BZN0_GILLR|nr:TonB-dependent receptor [Gillisia limnaea]EHQ03439.1 TonB-dependent receptor plug [Gillisia limnaea DSM 15749]
MSLKIKLSILFPFLFLGNIFGQILEGTVLNSVTSQPIENVTILNLKSEAVAFSNTEGEFRIPAGGLPVTLKITAIGFEEEQVVVNTLTDKIQIFLKTSTELLSEVMINSTLIPNQLRKLPASVSVISSADLKRIDAINLAQAFNNVPGVYVNQGALNTTKLNIRGIGARSQYSTNRIQAYFNGIPLSTAEGELTLDDIDPEALSRIEIIKGPASSIYGAGLGGVINLYAAEGEIDKTEAAGELLFGSFGMSKKTISASHGTKTTSLFANFSDLQTDGYRDNGQYNRKSGLIHGSLKTTENNKLSFLANFTRLKAFIPSSINESDFRNNPSIAASNWAASKGFESYDSGLLGVSYDHKFSSYFTNTTSVYFSFRDAYEPRPFDILKEERISAGVRTKFNLSAELFDRPSKISFGAEYYNEWYEIGTFENLYRDFQDQGSVLGTRLSNNEQDRNYSNLFGQLNLELNDKWGLETGLNLNMTNYSLTDLFVQDDIDQSGDYGFNTILSPRIATTYEVSANKNLYASVSHGFSTPTVAETLTPDGQLNTDLQPETGINYEIGFKGNWLNNSLYTEVALYSIQIDDLLVAQRIAEDRYVGVNAGKTNHNGIEFFAGYKKRLMPELIINPYINASINFFEFEEFLDRESNFSGNKLPGVPGSTVNVGLDLNIWNKLDIYSNFFAVGEIPLNDANSVFTNSYTLLNLKAIYTIDLIEDLNLNFTAGINNLTNEKYAASVLPNAVGFGGAAPRFYYPGNPRNYFGGVGLSYQF